MKTNKWMHLVCSLVLVLALSSAVFAQTTLTIWAVDDLEINTLFAHSKHKIPI